MSVFLRREVKQYTDTGKRRIEYGGGTTASKSHFQDIMLAQHIARNPNTRVLFCFPKEMRIDTFVNGMRISSLVHEPRSELRIIGYNELKKFDLTSIDMKGGGVMKPTR